MSEMIGPRPPTQKLELTGFRDRIALRAEQVFVINDEAHHTNEEGDEWNKVIRRVHAGTPLTVQLDFNATPRLQRGTISPWTFFDYELKQALILCRTR
jgi:hypothetical protein